MANDRLHFSLVIEGEGGPEVRRQIEEISQALDRIAQSHLSIPALRELSRDIESGRRALDSLDQETREAVEAFRRLKQISRRSLQDLSRRADRTSQELADLRRHLDRLFTLAGVAGFGEGVRRVIEASIDLEAALADVAKTTGASDAELQQLKQRLQEVAEEVGITADQLAKMAAIGGQMGLPTEQLAEFVRLVARIAVAFDMSAEEAAQAIGQIKGSLGVSIAEIERLGNQIDALANSMANVLERDVIEVLQRVSGTAKSFGLLPEQMAALAAAFLHLGKAPEVAATAINGLLTKLNTAQGQTRDFKQALQALGYTAESLAQRIQQNPTRALIQFLEKLRELPPQIRAVTTLKLFGMEYTDDVNALIGRLDALKQALRTVAQASPTGLLDAFTRRMETTRGEIDRLQAAIYNLATALGDVLNDDVARAANHLTELTRSLTELIQKNPELVQLAEQVGKAMAALMALSVGVRSVKGVARALTSLGDTSRSLRGLVSALGTVRGGLVALVGVPLGTAIGEWLTHLDRFGFKVRAVGSYLAELAALTEAAISRDFDRFKEIHQIFGQIRADLQKTDQAIRNFGGSLSQIALGELVRSVQEGKTSLVAFYNIISELQPNISQLRAAIASFNAEGKHAAEVWHGIEAAIQNAGLSANQQAQLFDQITQALIAGTLGLEQYRSALYLLQPSTERLKQAQERLRQALESQEGASSQVVLALDRVERKLKETTDRAKEAGETTKNGAEGLRFMGEAASSAAGDLEALGDDLELTRARLREMAGEVGAVAGVLESRLTKAMAEMREALATGDFEGVIAKGREAAQIIRQLAEAKARAAQRGPLADFYQNLARSLGYASVQAYFYAEAADRVASVQRLVAEAQRQVNREFRQSGNAAARSAAATKEISRQMAELMQTYNAGQISAEEYKRKMAELERGLASTGERAKEAGENLKKPAEAAAKALKDPQLRVKADTNPLDTYAQKLQEVSRLIEKLPEREIKVDISIVGMDRLQRLIDELERLDSSW